MFSKDKGLLSLITGLSARLIGGRGKIQSPGWNETGSDLLYPNWEWPS